MFGSPPPPPYFCGVVPHTASILKSYLSQMTGPGLAIATCSGAACTKLQSELAYLKALDKSFSIPLPWFPCKYVKIMNAHELAALCFY